MTKFTLNSASPAITEQTLGAGQTMATVIPGSGVQFEYSITRNTVVGVYVPLSGANIIVESLIVGDKFNLRLKTPHPSGDHEVDVTLA